MTYLRLCIAACLLMMNAAHASTGWLLSYTGKSANEFVWDKRADRLVMTRIPSKVAGKLMPALGGPPNPVVVVDRRYVSLSACRAHSCIEKGFLWVDTKTGVGLGAYFSDTLVIGSNGLSAQSIPAPARQALIDWLTEYDLRPESVAFVGANGVRSTLDASAFKARERFEPPPGGPAFDCKRASSRIDAAICGDAGLSALDLALSTLANDIRHGHGTIAAWEELAEVQRKWRQDRDSRCADAENVTACLKDSYRAQHERLRHWIPD